MTDKVEPLPLNLTPPNLVTMDDLAAPPAYGAPPAGYELIKHMSEVHVNRTTKNHMAGGCIAPMCCVMISNTKGEIEKFDIGDENGVVLLKTELMRRVSCICGIGPFEMSVALKVVDGPTLVEIHEKDSLMKFGNNKKYHAKSNGAKIGYFLKVPTDPVMRRDKNGNNRTVFTDVSYMCYDSDDNELFKIKGEKKMSEVARSRMPKVKMFIQTPDEVTEEFATVGVIGYKKEKYTIKFPDGFDWPLRLLVIMASTTIETELYGKLI